MLTQELPLWTPAQDESLRPRTQRPQPLRRETEDLLRDIAYVLHLTRRVRSEIDADR